MLRIDGKPYHGFIHRDIKPANLMVSEEGYIKLLDFGIAIPLGMFTLTMKHGNLVGTAPYCSPEQINGRELDHRSDLYATGNVLYELLTGECAFGRGTTIHEVLNNVLNGNYKPIDNFRIKIPKALRYLINKSMERDPNKRFESASAMLSLCNEAFRELTKETPEAVIHDFVEHQRFHEITNAQNVPDYLIRKKRKFLFW